MKFESFEQAIHNLRQMGAQFICPKDQFFGPLADAIEELHWKGRQMNEEVNALKVKVKTLEDQIVDLNKRLSAIENRTKEDWVRIVFDPKPVKPNNVVTQNDSS